MIAPAPHRGWITAIARAIALFLVLFLVVWLTIQFLVGPSEVFIPTATTASRSIETISKFMEAGVSSVDQAVSMLTAVQLSVFIVVGFVLRETLTTARRPTPEQIIAAAVFLCCAFASLSLGYGARIQAIGIVNNALDGNYSGFGAVQTTVVHQAFFVVVSAISTVYLVVVALLDTGGKLNPAQPTGITDPITVAAALTTVVVTGDDPYQSSTGQGKGGS